MPWGKTPALTATTPSRSSAPPRSPRVSAPVPAPAPVLLSLRVCACAPFACPVRSGQLVDRGKGCEGLYPSCFTSMWDGLRGASAQQPPVWRQQNTTTNKKSTYKKDDDALPALVAVSNRPASSSLGSLVTGKV